MDYNLWSIVHSRFLYISMRMKVFPAYQIYASLQMKERDITSLNLNNKIYIAKDSTKRYTEF